MKPPLLIVSAGAETLAASLVQWASKQKERDVYIFSLNDPSIFDKLKFRIKHCKNPSREFVKAELEEYINEIYAKLNIPVSALASEDDSHGLLISIQEKLTDRVRVSRCHAIRNGGLSKAEVFEELKKNNLAELMPPTVVVRQISDLYKLENALGSDFVIKPDHKPWKRVISGAGKLYRSFEIKKYRGEIDGLLGQGQPWIAQKKMRPFPDGERCVWVARGTDFILTGEYIERLKYPAHGGSGCWVQTNPTSSQLSDRAKLIADALDLHGIAEIPFLLDENNEPRMLEINSRPWLQTELIEYAGVDIIGLCVDAIEGQPSRQKYETPLARKADWIQIERFLSAVITGDGHGRWENLKKLITALRNRPMYALWSIKLHGVRWQFFRRLVSRILPKKQY